MYKKIRGRLTLLSAGITIGIMIVMSFGYLYVSEKSLRTNYFTAFQSNASNVFTNMEQETIINHRWLTQLEVKENFFIRLKDNGVDFLFNRLDDTEARQSLFAGAEAAYSVKAAQSGETQSQKAGTISHEEYSFLHEGRIYYAGYADIFRENGILNVLIVFDTGELELQILSQRLLFAGINVVTVIILFISSFAFVGKLLRPLEENQRRQSQFVAAASHELRTPLAAILSSASACQKAEEQEKGGFLEAIVTEGQRMSRLVDDMLVLAGSDSQSWRIEKAYCEPDTMLLNAYESFQAMAKEKEIGLSILLPEKVITPCLLDEGRMMQVFAVLIHNALSYTPKGGWVRLSAELADKTLVICVSDNGIGIPDEEKENIFRRFYRINQSRTGKAHFGLGLCIAAEIVQAHRGSIGVTDTLGGGSTFVIKMPFQASPS